MKCSFIVSAYDRPDALACCLYSLKIQTERDFEVIVADNSGDFANTAVVIQVNDRRFTHYRAGSRDCYESSNGAALLAQGEYLCFPSDDGYYAPRFLELMLQHGDGADLIYCNCAYDGHGSECAFFDVTPTVGGIDKGGFLLRRQLFTEFAGPVGLCRAADGQLVEQVVRAGATHQKVPIVGWAHN